MELEDQVWAALDTACANGYGEFVRLSAPITVAHDLIDYDVEFEKCTPEELIPHVESWQKAHE